MNEYRKNGVQTVQFQSESINRSPYRDREPERLVSGVSAQAPTNRAGNAERLRTVCTVKSCRDPLEQILADACDGLPMTVDQLRQALSVDDLDDLKGSRIGESHVRAFIELRTARLGADCWKVTP